MPEEMTTKPTIETVLERIASFENGFGIRFEELQEQVKDRFDRVDERLARVDERFDSVDERFNSVDERFNRVDERFDRIENELDRVASLAHSTKAELLTLRADFRELRGQLMNGSPFARPS
jgi:archaellum component FlaC